MTFGNKFRAQREKRNLTQQQVADDLRMNRRMITRYENGISYPRTRDAYKKIADYFDMDVNYFLIEEQEESVIETDTCSMKTAREVIWSVSDLFNSGDLSEQEKEDIMKELQDIYKASIGIS